MWWYGRVHREQAIVALIVAVVVIARVASFAYFSSLAAGNPDANPYPVVAGDSVHYAQWGNNLLTLHAYQETPGEPLRAAPPGYPALLAGIKFVTGSMTPVVILQILLASLASVLIYRMARTFTPLEAKPLTGLIPAPYALLPALVYALDPMTVFSDSAIMTDGIFSALLVCTVYVAFFQSRVRGPVRWGLVGLLLGGLTMIRPIAEFLVVVFPAMYLLREWLAVRQSNPMSDVRVDGARWKATVACIAGFVLVVTPWMIRNHTHFGSYEISPLGGHNLLTFSVRGFLAWRVLGETEQPLPAILVLRHANDPVFSAVDATIAKDLAAITPQGEDTQSYEGQLAVRYILHDPIGYAYFHAVNTIPFFLSSSIAFYGQLAEQVRDNQGFYAPTMLSLFDALGRMRHPESLASFTAAVLDAAPILLEMMFWMLVSLLALIALILRRRDFSILLFVVLVAYFAALTGPMAMARYRVPAEPYLLILAVVGAYEVVHRLKNAWHERTNIRTSAGS